MKPTTDLNLRIGAKLAAAIEKAAHAVDVPPATFCKVVLAQHKGKPPADPDEPRTVRYLIRLRTDIAARLESQATAHGVTLSELVRGILAASV